MGPAMVFTPAPPTPPPPPGATPNPTPLPDPVVKTELVILNVDYDALLRNPQVAHDFKNAIKSPIAKKLNIRNTMITVELSAGTSEVSEYPDAEEEVSEYPETEEEVSEYPDAEEEVSDYPETEEELSEYPETEEEVSEYPETEEEVSEDPETEEEVSEYPDAEDRRLASGSVIAEVSIETTKGDFNAEPADLAQTLADSAGDLQTQ